MEYRRVHSACDAHPDCIAGFPSMSTKPTQAPCMTNLSTNVALTPMAPLMIRTVRSAKLGYPAPLVIFGGVRSNGFYQRTPHR